MLFLKFPFFYLFMTILFFFFFEKWDLTYIREEVRSVYYLGMRNTHILGLIGVELFTKENEGREGGRG